ncbi:hypothetical protein Celaphus_00002823 [Cervus elaphus hippelaphus]|uniref:Uncharacterized protein n=1 Tax=Cervus elaphus hippelaphus TaxID=46360 RepID=A0A212CHM6_CEREH|nr:hypothetical protein Celaphus_00002823 [Cervus elaphus hippelaphus]
MELGKGEFFFLIPEVMSSRSSNREAKLQPQCEVRPKDDEADLGLQGEHHVRGMRVDSQGEGAD